MSSIPISKEGFQALEQELDRLKKSVLTLSRPLRKPAKKAI